MCLTMGIGCIGLWVFNALGECVSKKDFMWE